MAHAFNDSQQEYCDKCSYVQLVSQISPSPHFSVIKCPVCYFKKYKCRYCSATQIIRRWKNNHRKIKKHVETTHPEKLTSSTSPGIQQSLVLNDTVAFKNDDSVTNTCGGLVNDGTETETDFLGHNEPSDENHVSHLVDSMSENNSDSQCISYEYSPPPHGRKVDNLDSFKFSATTSQMCTFGKTTFAARTESHMEGSVASFGGRWPGWICMSETKLHHKVMQG